MLPGAEVDGTNAVVGIVTLLLGGSAATAYNTLKKAPAEAGEIAANTLIAVNQELRAELDRNQNVIAGMRNEVDQLRERVRSSTESLEQMAGELKAARMEIDDLESRLGEHGH